MNIPKYPDIRIILIMLTAVIVAACATDRQESSRMDRAETLMEAHPDSAIMILDSINTESLRGEADKARYALLMSIALDKNYIDTTTFDVLQPAIDYYLKHGTPDQKLRTYYYQGVIYKNQNNTDDAIIAYNKAKSINNIKDSMVLARCLIGEAVLCNSKYNGIKYKDLSLEAANIYKKIGRIDLYVKSLLRVLNGCILLEDKNTADSIIARIKPLSSVTPAIKQEYEELMLNYYIYLANLKDEQLRPILEKYQNLSNLTEDTKIDLANGFVNIGDFQKAEKQLSDINIVSEHDSIKYFLTLASVLDSTKSYKKSLEAYKEYLYITTDNWMNISARSEQIANKQFNLEKNIYIEKEKRKRQIIIGSFIICLLILGIIIIYNLYKNIKLKKELSDKELFEFQLMSKVQKTEINNLNREKNILTNLLNNGLHNESAMQIITSRLNTLNGILAMEISDNAKYTKHYYDELKEIINNREKFFNDTIATYNITHPGMIDHLKQYGLTQEELILVCLYGLGLRGKEIGTYMDIKNHYKLSSSIRQKLNLNEHDTNLNKYIISLMEKYKRTNFHQ